MDRLKAAVIGALPDMVAERVLPWKRAEFRAAGVSSTRPAKTRLLIGPVNSAGQGYAWARAAERLPDVAAANFMYRGANDVFGYPADHSVPTTYFVSNRRWQRAQARAVRKGFTHVLFESGRALLGTEPPLTDIERLRRRGIHVALLWHGSDIRTPSAHAAAEDDSPFRNGEYPDQGRLEEISRRNHDLMIASGAPMFVSTPDLLSYLPEATWLPVVVDPDRWADAAAVPPMARTRPVVVHVPSRAGLKGTALVSQTLRALDHEGLIEYRELEGIAAADMPAVYGDADIVLDQFSLGIYGVAACEAMASGRVVISHVAEDVRARVRSATGRTLPIMEARASQIEAILRDVVADPRPALAIAHAGPEFVRDMHDGRRSSAALRTYLGVSEGDMGDWNNAD
ncbi:hypothetical protein MZK47_11030 [Microbacterium aerolatum]|uniref:hypothetical protein n=1 Tax=Microbacterium aerolatum TaxID=153731 RepID=UPI002000C16D|nr:hypothetical protein [Microbacterium aerolatum]MCK3770202.1 hypothetical protein [Microbacterium aerolatum]